jgi:ABC-2 type transport system permease protein
MPDSASLTPSRELGWISGFINMLARENKIWWNARFLAIQILVWLVIINGAVALAVILIPPMAYPPVQSADIGFIMFFELSGIAMLIGVVIIGHGSIAGERESGTAAWLLSKPLSRKSFVLSKLVANSIGMLTIMVLAQGIAAYAICSVVGHSLGSITGFLAGLALLGLDLMFFMVLSIALGAFTCSKGVTLGVPLLVALAGTFILPLGHAIDVSILGQYPGNIPGYIMPWSLAGTAVSLSTGAPVDAAAAYPVAATVIWIILFALAAIYRFDSLEF